MPSYFVRQGDCLSSIAQRHGLFWEMIWNHELNAELKSKRKNPDVLSPGDEVFIPEREEKQESVTANQHHRFRQKGIPAKLRLRLLDDDEYQLHLGHIDPVEEVTGIQERLNNLGFDCGKVDGVLGPKTETALQAFQEKFDIKKSGKADEESQKKLLEIHGS